MFESNLLYCFSTVTLSTKNPTATSNNIITTTPSTIMKSWSPPLYYSAPPAIKRNISPPTTSPLADPFQETEPTYPQRISTTEESFNESELAEIFKTEDVQLNSEYEWIDFQDSNIVQKSQPLQLSKEFSLNRVYKTGMATNENGNISQLALYSSIALPLLAVIGNQELFYWF